MSKESYKDRMEKAISSLQNDLKGIRTGRANASILDGVKVEAYGNSMPLKQVGNVSTPDSKTIMIQPFDKNLIGDIEKAVLKADLGFNPFNDGGNIRIIVPCVIDEQTLLINIHEYTHAYEAYLRLGETYMEDIERSEDTARQNEQLYLARKKKENE